MTTYRLLLIFPVLLLLSCSTGEPLSDEQAERDEFGDIEYSDLSDEFISEYVELDEMDELQRLLFSTRNRLSDLNTMISHDMPEAFLMEVATTGNEVDIRSGYRIQILSTRDVTEADSTESRFITWADSVFQAEAPRSYIFFRPPYYRVRIGDFHDREKAIELSRIVKDDYPDAWVVHDQINPEYVPADTVSYEISAGRMR